MKQLPLSVLILCGVPLSVKRLVKIFRTVRNSVFLHTCAVGHLLKRSTATNMFTSPRLFDLSGPAKSKFGSVKISRLFFSVDGICVTMFLPAALQVGHVSVFFPCISRCMPGHQKASASQLIHLGCGGMSLMQHSNNGQPHILRDDYFVVENNNEVKNAF